MSRIPARLQQFGLYALVQESIWVITFDALLQLPKMPEVARPYLAARPPATVGQRRATMLEKLGSERACHHMTVASTQARRRSEMLTRARMGSIMSR